MFVAFEVLLRIKSIGKANNRPTPQEVKSFLLKSYSEEEIDRAIFDLENNDYIEELKGRAGTIYLITNKGKMFIDRIRSLTL